MVALITQKQIEPLITADQLDAIQGANFPSSSNVFATMNDLSGSVVPTSHIETSDVNSTYFYSGLEITADDQTALSISQSPIAPASTFLFLNGQWCPPGPTTDNTHWYTMSGANITWNNSNLDGVKLKEGDNVTVQYNYLGSGSIYEDTGDITVNTWVCTATASVPTSKIRLIRFGKLVTLYLMNWFATGNGNSDSISAPAGIIPIQFRPVSGGGIVTGFASTTRAGYVGVIVPLIGTGFAGFTAIGVDGSIVVNMNAEGDTFNTIAGQPFGFSNSSISWMIP